MTSLRGTLLVLAMLFGFSDADGAPSSPSSTVKGFLADYELWNSRAVARNTDDPEQLARTLKISEQEYLALIQKYCAKSVRPQPIAFGTGPSHSQLDEIKSVRIDGSSAVVVAGHVVDLEVLKYVQLTEFHLATVGNRWLITSALAILDDGKYELL